MTSDGSGRDNLSFFFSDDSSTEDELVRVAEKLEMMQGKEAELAKKLILPVSNNTSAKHVAEVSAANGGEFFEIRKEDGKNSSTLSRDGRKGRDPRQWRDHEVSENGVVVTGNTTTINGILSEKEGPTREDNFEQNKDNCKSPRPLHHRDNRKRPQNSTQRMKFTANTKATIPKDAKSLYDQRTNKVDEGRKDGNVSAFFPKANVEGHGAGTKKRNEVIVDLTTMESNCSSSNNCDSTSSDPRTMSTHDDDSSKSSFSSSSSSLLSNDLAEEGNEKLLRTQNKSFSIRNIVHQGEREHASNESLAVAARSVETNRQQMVSNSDRAPNMGVQKTIVNRMDKRRSPGSLRSSKVLLRNPYLREKFSSGIESSERESTSTHGQVVQGCFPNCMIPKKAPKLNSDENGRNNENRSLRPTSSKKVDLAPSTQTKENNDEQRMEKKPASEISRSLYAPPVCRDVRPSPIVHRFGCRSHPLHSRESASVGLLDSIFSSKIVKSFWGEKFDKFNHFQSTMVDALSHTDKNIVISAPTGAGKSTIFELAMARFFSMDLKVRERQGGKLRPLSSTVSKARKIVYIAPSKALCEERYADWSRRLRKMDLGLEVTLITGQDGGSEEAFSAFPDLVAAHLIVTTPEKWDSMTRRWSENFFLFASVKLLLLDEVHLLGDDTRGWCLESIVTRMKTIQRAASALTTTKLEINASSYKETNPDALGSCFRVIGVSATLPNLSEVAEFLEANEAYCFDDSYRPIPLTKHVNGLGRVGNNEWRFWSNLSEYVPDIIQRFSHRKQSLIFCHSKKETQKVAELLIRRNFGNKGVQTLNPPWNKPVEYMISHGIGYHHAGMSRDERKIIEEAFLQKKIKCLAATSTLAVGVNLPAHLVIIVGTKAWRNNENGKGYQEIEVNSLLQMVGRAGRPGLDSTGVAVVLTDNSSKTRIEGILESGIGPAKSHLISRLPEVLNSEISQQVVTSMDEVVRWLQTTFFFCTLKRKKNVLSLVQEISTDALRQLREIGVVETGELHSICPLLGCFIMNRRLLTFQQMKSISALPFDASQCQILRTLSKLENLQSFVRRNEKRELKEFHKSNSMKYKLPGALSKYIVKDPSEKAFILLQSYISRHRFKNEMLNEEQITVRDEAIKVLEVAQEYSAKASKHGKVALECYKLQRSLNYALWGESSGVFNQFEWIGSSKTASNILKSNGIRSFQDVLSVTEEKLDEIFAQTQILGLPKNASRIVKHTARDLCRYRLELSTDIVCTKNSNKPTELICSLKYDDHTATMERGEREQDLKFSLIAYTGRPKASSLIFEENISSASTFRIPLPSQSFEKLFVHLVGTWIGFDQKKIINGTDTIVSSYGTARKLNQDPTRISIETDGLQARSNMKKRRCPNGSFSLNQRQDQKRQCPSATEVKEPSPVTPQPKDQNQEISHMTAKNNPQSSHELCEGFEATGRSMTTITSRYSAPLNQQQPDKTPVSTNVTPTTQIRNKKNISHSRRPVNLQRRGVVEHMTSTHVSNQEFDKLSEVSGVEKYSGQSTHHVHRDQQRTPDSERKECIDNESPAAAPRTNKGVRSQMHSSNERVRQSGTWTDYRMSAPEATDKVGQFIKHPSSLNLRERNRGKDVWNQSRTKQHRSQKRAFTEKRMNPFRSFSHDPNDFERHLEQLSHQSSIIPNPLLAKMKQSSITTNGKYQPRFFTDRSRRTRTVRDRYSNQQPQDVLREKAFEQQFQHEMKMSHRQSSSRRFHRQNNYEESRSLLPMDTNQREMESFRNVQNRPGYAPSYLENNERLSHFRDSPPSPGPLYLPQKVDGHGTYRNMPGGQYITGLRSDGSRFRRERIFQHATEHDRPINVDSYGSSFIHSDNQFQHQSPKRGQIGNRRLPNSPLDFESDFL